MDEGNLRTQLRQPWVKISTDAGGVDPSWAAPHGPTHPRAYGTYTRVLGRYVREERVLGLEDAVRKMSGAVADRLGLRDRGQLRAGFYADVVVFDPATVSDRATFEDSHRLSTGVRAVWVVYPSGPRLQLHLPDRSARTLGPDDDVDGGEALPGFRMRLRDLLDPYGPDGLMVDG
jgi:hypothetical protein